MENIWYVSFVIIFIIISGYCVYLMCRKEEMTFESVFISGRQVLIVVLLLISITLLVAVLLCEFDEVRKNVLSTTGTALVSILTGVFSSTLVSAYYRNKDDKRDKEDYILALKRHITSVYRTLKIIQFSTDYNSKIEYTENLRNELLYAPKYQKRFKLSEDEMKALEEYQKNLENIKSYISEYVRCKNVIYVLEKNPNRTIDDEKNLYLTKEQQKMALERLGAYNSLWMITISKFEI